MSQSDEARMDRITARHGKDTIMILLARLFAIDDHAARIKLAHDEIGLDGVAIVRSIEEHNRRKSM